MERLPVFVCLPLAGLLACGCGGGASKSSGAPTENLPAFSAGNLEGRAAITNPPIVVNTDSSTFTGLVGSFSALKALNYASDWQNSRIVFVGNRNGSNQVYMMNPDGSEVTQVTNEAGPASQPVVSPDGTKIAYVLSGPTQSDLFIINSDGSGRTALTNTANLSESHPTFSPDGNSVAFEVRPSAGGQYDISRVNISTKVVTPIEAGAESVRHPSWDHAVNVLWCLDESGWFRRKLDGSLVGEVGVAGTATGLLAGPYARQALFRYETNLYLRDSGSMHSKIVDTAIYDVGGISPDSRFGLYSASDGLRAQLYRVNLQSQVSSRITFDVFNYQDPFWGAAPKTQQLIGSSNNLALNANAFLYGQQGDRVVSAVAAKATTPSSMVVATQSSQNPGPNVIYTIDADVITNLSFANGSFFRPTRVVGVGAPIGDANGAILSFDSSTGKVVNAIAFAGSRGAKPTIDHHGSTTVFKGQFSAVIDSNGKNLGQATEVILQDGKTTVR